MVELERKRVFATGGAGFIGSHLLDKLMARMNHVTVYDNLSSGSEDFIDHHWGNPRFRFVKADLLDADQLEDRIRNHDIVFHLAANPDAAQGMVNTRLDLELNTIATYNVLEAMRKGDVEGIAFSSSGTVYGNWQDLVLEESHGPLFPISLYGASKLACEGLISAFSHLFGIQAWIFRFGNVVGPRPTHGVIYDLLNKLKKNSSTLEVLGDGNQTKPYVYVDDCVDGMIFGVEKAHDKLNLFNLAVSTNTSVKGIVKVILEKTGHSETTVKYTGGKSGWLGDVPTICLDSRKIQRLGWKPRYTSHEAVAKTVDDIIKQMKFRVTM